MKSYMTIIIALFFIPLFMSSTILGQETIEGTYLIYNSEQKIETDTYEIIVGEKYNDDILTANKQERRIAQAQYENRSLVNYQQTLNGLPYSGASVEKKMLKLYEREALVGVFPVESDVYLLDQSLYTQYAMLINIFEQKKEAKARFEVLIPQLQDFWHVDIERHGADDFVAGDKTINANHYRITIGKRETINCWAIGNKIIGIFIASKNIYVADASYAGLYESLKKTINRAM